MSESNDIQTAKAQELAKELEEQKFDLGGYQDPVHYLKDYLKTTKLTDPAKIAEDVEQILSDNGKKNLLASLIIDKAERYAKKIQPTESMDELKPNLKAGEYPYLHGYNSDLYNKQIRLLQIELIKLQKWLNKTGKKLVVIFEGRDAAGKGGTIQRFVEHLNPRSAKIAALPKPDATEVGQWYFQRYVAHLPTSGEMVFFDRSWYNRAVVEPVMGFCTKEQYDTFMKEVPSFEQNIISSGLTLIKFWLDVSQSEQLRRFKQRRKDPLKRWKLSPVDLASLSKWDDYTKAINAMFFNTDTEEAPWTVIRSDDKLRARLNAIRSVLLRFDYEGRNDDVIGEVDPRIVFRASSVNGKVDGNSSHKHHKGKKGKNKKGKR